MRLDRFITLQLVRPVQRTWWSLKGRPAATNSCGAIPILMYHSITDSPEAGTSPYYQVNTSPGVFREHLRFLGENGYKTVSLSALVDRLSPEGAPQTSNLDSHLAVITFDDGFRNFATHAFPALQEHGFTATMFLPTAFIHDQRKSFKGTECLTWNEVRELRRAGIEFGSHTANHPLLVNLSADELRRELQESKEVIEQEISAAAPTFCYPYAFPQANVGFVRGFREALSNAGYSCCATTRIGRVRRGDDPFTLKRLPANANDDSSLLRAKLCGAYDWVAFPQRLFKRLKRLSEEPVDCANSRS
jgi:peptidoglycan/xylan/chitin deacetylase (PgdA/CDA1 family)